MALTRYSAKPYLSEETMTAIANGGEVRVTNTRIRAEVLGGVVVALIVFGGVGLFINANGSGLPGLPGAELLLLCLCVLTLGCGYVFGLAPGVRLDGVGIHVVGAVYSRQARDLSRFSVPWSDIAEFAEPATAGERGVVAVTSQGTRRQLSALPFSVAAPFGLNRDPRPMLAAFNSRLALEKRRGVQAPQNN